MIQSIKTLLLLAFLSMICYSQDQSIDPDFFYAKSSGREIMNPENYPKEIMDFLEDEKKLILNSLNFETYESLLEVGCAEGVKAKEIVHKGYYYHGIDINEVFIKNAIELFSRVKIVSKATAQNISFFDLDNSHPFLQKKCLILFPFNLFGNLDEQKTLDRLFLLKKDFMIITYTFDEKAREIRSRYYRNCQYKDLKLTLNNNFETFSSSEGLNSICYNQEYLKQMIINKAKSLDSLSIPTITVQPFNDIGIAILVKFI